MKPRIAVVMTSHNRRTHTVDAIRAVLNQAQADQVRVYLADDGSQDGTPSAARELGARVIEADGTLYWAAGMAVAERAAWRSEPDFLLWLNDDVVLDIDALHRLLETSAENPGIIVGATRDPDTGDVTYGGRLRISRWHPQRLVLAGSHDHVVPVDSFHGNVVLVPAAARRLIGPIDDLYPHAYADDDYGYRALAAGVRVSQAPGTVGTCVRSVPAPQPTGCVAAWRARQQPKGLPWRAQVRFLRRHGGLAWPVTFLGQQVAAFVRRNAYRSPR